MDKYDAWNRICEIAKEAEGIGALCGLLSHDYQEGQEPAGSYKIGQALYAVDAYATRIANELTLIAGKEMEDM